jgi:predicted DNA-binding antitoxin AbrB/MazE fold protein
MLKSYEATYDKGMLKWVQEKPDIEDGEKVIVVVDVRTSLKNRRKEIRKALEGARGAWGTGKSLAEIDREIDARRAADWPGDGVTRL